MSNFRDMLSDETKSAAKQFIINIENKTIVKTILPNSEEVFPNDKALKSFDSLLNSELSNHLFDS